ncbi:MAG: hypothetical protein AAFR96_09350 [Planctomycetota bacterium]
MTETQTEAGTETKAATEAKTGTGRPSVFDQLLRRVSVGSVTIEIDGETHTLAVQGLGYGIRNVAQAAFPSPEPPPPQKNPGPKYKAALAEYEARAGLIVGDREAAIAATVVGLPIEVPSGIPAAKGQPAPMKLVSYGDTWGALDASLAQVEYMRLAAPIVKASMSAEHVDAIIRASVDAASGRSMRDAAGKPSAQTSIGTSTAESDQASDEADADAAAGGGSGRSSLRTADGAASTGGSSSASGSGTGPSRANASTT